MIRQLTNSAAQIRTIETREEAVRNEAFFSQLYNLYRELTDRTPARNISQLVNSNLNFIFITEATNLIGSATLAVTRTAIRCRGHVEDVVVARGHQDSGFGKILVQGAINLARKHGCHCLQLTSKPDRCGTSCFYPKLGFELIATALPGHREGTHLYRYEF